MSSFAPVYRPSTTQQSFLTREQKRERKRKRNALDDSDDPDISSNTENEQDAPRVLHPVNKTDPYYVAGYAREKPLPGGNFPHATLKAARKPQLPAEEEFSHLKPPIYVPKIAQTDHASSLRARHLDNLTAILHKCILRDDWERASRAWGLILRTEIAGRGIDVRQNGRWTVGAEILMRRDQVLDQIRTRRLSSSSTDEHEEANDEAAGTIKTPVLKDESFKKARDYYERLIVQHPHLQRTHHSIITALSIQPARFSLWIYQVQDKSKRERKKTYAAPGSTDSDMNTSPRSNRNDRSYQQRKVRQLRNEEHEEALEIALQLDELLVSPPYDTSREMLYTRGMVALWLYDLQMELSRVSLDNAVSGTSDDGEGDSSLEQSTTTQAHTQRLRASRIFHRLLKDGMELPPSAIAFLEEEEDRHD